MPVYKFKVFTEEADDLFREIEIKSSQTFLDFHNGIIKAFDIKKKRPASFFISDNRWKKNAEIAINQTLPMEGSKDGAEEVVGNTMKGTGDRLVYVNDATPQITFLIELIETNVKEAKGATYPRSVKSAGSIAGAFSESIFEEDLGLSIDDNLDNDDFVVGDEPY